MTTDLLLTGILAALVYLCGTSTLQYIWMWREQRSAFASRADQKSDRERTLGTLADLVEVGLIELELKEAGGKRRQTVVAGVRQKEQEADDARAQHPLEGSLDLVHDLILRTSPDDGVRA